MGGVLEGGESFRKFTRSVCCPRAPRALPQHSAAWGRGSLEMSVLRAALGLSRLPPDVSGVPLTDLLMTGCGPVFAMQHVVGVPHALARRGLLGRELFVTRTLCSPGPSTPRQKRPEEVALGLYHRLPSLGRALWHSIQQQASSTAKAWWGRYEEFVGLNEVREAQGNVTEVRRGAGWPALPCDLGTVACRLTSSAVVL